MIQLLPEFREFLSLLNSNRVRCLLIGGYAVAFHGHPRTTGDLDVWIAADPANINGLRRALLQFGFPESSIPAGVFIEPRTTLRMGFEPHRIEVLKTIAGVEFEACWARADKVRLDGVDVRIIGRADLVTNKRAAGRLKDLADVEALETPKRKPRRTAARKRRPKR
ncbi:hypothetical protein RAS1_02350 [Phycisphaerae bacterium RAS1]|nr:hypothetical protein RAS1_02350 [Phycisphaerae bacterium RAS1]